MPLVSVGIPVYNGERFVGHALESLLGQTLADIEVIISDNASTDRTAEVCRSFAERDARVRYLRQPSNIGALRNFNLLPDKARGRYFKWHPANDYCDPRMLERCVAVLEDDPAAVLCQGRTLLVDEDTGDTRLYEPDAAATAPRPSERFSAVTSLLSLNNELFGVTRLDVLKRTPLMRPYEGGDLVLTMELSLYGRIVLLPEVLFYRRMGPRTNSMGLKPEELQAFIHAEALQPRPAPAWRRRVDLLGAIWRAPVGRSEKLRIVTQAARRAVGKLQSAHR